MNAITIFPVPGIPEVQPGDDLANLISAALRGAGLDLRAGDVVVITQKVVSKAEGRLVALSAVEPSPEAVALAESTGRRPQEVELVLRESREVVKAARQVLIVETKQGVICANAGLDHSNIPGNMVALLPADPDASAAALRQRLMAAWGVEVAVVISDTFGRPWRMGQTNVAIGVAGMLACADYRGTADTFGRELKVTEIAVADELAAAAELVMGKTLMVPVAVVRGYAYPAGEGSARSLLRPKEQDLFR